VTAGPDRRRLEEERRAQAAQLHADVEAWKQRIERDGYPDPAVVAEIAEALTAAIVRGARAGVDLGDALSTALGAAATELGGVSHVIAGRPGSWESQHLLGLAQGVLGNSEVMDRKPWL
jgi:hypothetical protein